jgi:hypothetical protein
MIDLFKSKLTWQPEQPTALETAQAAIRPEALRSVELHRPKFAGHMEVSTRFFRGAANLTAALYFGAAKADVESFGAASL